MDLSIIIVSYNTCNLTLDAIKSIYQSITEYRYEVLVVDNASSDNSVTEISKRYANVKLIENHNNVGFSRANNQAMRVASGRYILLLNSDTIIDSNTIQTMVDFMDNNPKVGASGCKVVLPDGSLDKACRRGFPTPSTSFYYLSGLSKLFPTSPTINRYHYGHLNPNDAYPVDCLVGAFMLVRKETIDEIGMLDEDFFMYGEDIDWCYRIKAAGWEIYYNPYTTITHYKGASSKKKPFKIIYEFHRAMYLFHRKHYQQKHSLLLNSLVYLGIFVKLCLAVVKNQLKINNLRLNR